MKKPHLFSLVASMLVLPALSQESPSYRLKETVLNAAGHPAGVTTLSSASFRITLDSLGEECSESNLLGTSFHSDVGFSIRYSPPGEVRGLRFTDRQTLIWNPDRSARTYNLYRDAVGDLPLGAYGTCLQMSLEEETAIDAETPTDQVGWFYLVTVQNRVGEEGTKGKNSLGAERPNPNPCP